MHRLVEALEHTGLFLFYTIEVLKGFSMAFPEKRYVVSYFIKTDIDNIQTSIYLFKAVFHLAKTLCHLASEHFCVCFFFRLSFHTVSIPRR